MNWLRPKHFVLSVGVQSPAHRATFTSTGTRSRALLRYRRRVRRLLAQALVPIRAMPRLCCRRHANDCYERFRNCVPGAEQLDCQTIDYAYST